MCVVVSSSGGNCDGLTTRTCAERTWSLVVDVTDYGVGLKTARGLENEIDVSSEFQHLKDSKKTESVKAIVGCCQRRATIQATDSVGNRVNCSTINLQPLPNFISSPTVVPTFLPTSGDQVTTKPAISNCFTACGQCEGVCKPGDSCSDGFDKRIDSILYHIVHPGQKIPPPLRNPEDFINDVFLSFITYGNDGSDGICRFVRSVGERDACAVELCSCFFSRKRDHGLEWRDWTSCITNAKASIKQPTTEKATTLAPTTEESTTESATTTKLPTVVPPTSCPPSLCESCGIECIPGEKCSNGFRQRFFSLLWQIAYDKPKSEVPPRNQTTVIDTLYRSFLLHSDTDSSEIRRASKPQLCRLVRAVRQRDACAEELCPCFFSKPDIDHGLLWDDWSSCLVSFIPSE